MIAVASGTDVPAQMRAAGAATVLFDLNFSKRVGTTSAPADPSVIDARAQSLFDYAVSVTGCQTPTIAESELAGAQTPAPWTANNAQYRADVLQFLTDLTNLGRDAAALDPEPALHRRRRALLVAAGRQGRDPAAPGLLHLSRTRSASTSSARPRRACRCGRACAASSTT